MVNLTCDAIGVPSKEATLTIVLKLRPELEARLSADAEKCGLTMEEYVGRLIQEPRAESPLTPAERIALWEGGLDDLPPAPLLSDEAIGRGSIYGERE